MAVKSVRRLDDQGRIVLPNNIRKALNLGGSSVVTVDMDEDGTIRIRASYERCAVCGESVENKHHTKVEVSKKNTKNVCYSCAQAIARGMIKQM